MRQINLLRHLRLPVRHVALLVLINISLVALATELPPNTSAYEAARYIERTYVSGLRLKGVTADEYVKVMLKEGFRCSIEAVNPVGIDLPPHSSCDKSTNSYGSRCPAFRVTATFARANVSMSQKDLYARLGSVDVVSTSVHCMRPFPISPEYLAAKEQAEQAYGQSVEAVGKMSTAKDAFDYLLLDGYYCGFAGGAGAANGVQQPVGLSCYRFRTGIRYCFRGNLVLDVEWPPGLRTFEEHYASLAAARITGMKTSCEIPAIEGGGKPT